MTETGDAALLGRTIAGKFRVVRFLGGGAMGAVYLAYQTALDKNVAVKVMHRNIAVDANFAGRFHREARAASRLDHPNSMRVIDFGEEPDGLLYIAMEYLDGRDLYKVIHEDWPLSNARIVDVLSQALAALVAAHDGGVIHRDLKPENIMILKGKDDDGRDADVVKVCDFGIAKITEKDESPESRAAPGQKLTTQGLVVGTPEYMSPEQAQGETLDPRSDLYSMGIILFQLLTGRTPFEADSALAVVLKHITEQPRAPREIYPGVHPGLEAVCVKAIAKPREARFQSAREMRNALRAALDGRPMPIDTGAATAHMTQPGMSVPPTGAPPQVYAMQASSKVTPLGTAATAPSSIGGPRSAAPLVFAVAGVALLGGAGALFAFKDKVFGERARGASVPQANSVVSAAPTAAASITAEPRSASGPAPSAEPTDVPKANTAALPTGRGPRAAVPSPRGATDPSPPASAATMPAVDPSPPPAPPPATTPEPTPPPAPPPPPTPQATPAAPPWTPASCRAQVGAVKSDGRAAAKDLRMNNTGAAYTACAKSSLRDKPQGPIGATVTVQFGDNKAFRGATCAGCPGALAACVVSATRASVSVDFRGGDVTGDPSFAIPVTFTCD